MFQTFQTKIKNEVIVLPNNESEHVYRYLSNSAIFFSQLERKLFVDLYVRKKPSNKIKVFYCATYQITSRQYNSIKSQLEGRVKSKKELQKLNIEDLKERIRLTESVIKKKIDMKDQSHSYLVVMKGNEKSFPKKVKNYRSLRQFIHQKKESYIGCV